MSGGVRRAAAAGEVHTRAVLQAPNSLKGLGFWFFSGLGTTLSPFADLEQWPQTVF